MTNNIIVNMLYWITFTNKVIKAYTSEDGTYVSLERAVVLEQQRAKSSTNPIVTVDKVVDTVKDPSTGKKHDKVYYKVTEMHKHYTKNAIKDLGKAIKNDALAGFSWLNLLQTIENNNYIVYDKDKLVSVPVSSKMAFIVVPQHVLGGKTAQDKTTIRKDFRKFVYKIMDTVPTYVLYRDENNYIMVHNHKIVTTTKSGEPGFKLEGNSLRHLWAKLVYNIQIDAKYKHLHINFKLLRNEYYRKLVELAKKTNSSYLLDMINNYSGDNLTSHKNMSEAKEFEAVFNMLDITTPYELNTDVDKFAYKVYMLYYLRIAGLLKEYLPTTYDEYKATAITRLLNKVLKTALDTTDVLVEEELNIKEDYVMVDGQSVQLKDDMDPHQAYLNE